MPDYKEVKLNKINHFNMSIYNTEEDISDILNKWYTFDRLELLYTYINNIRSDSKTIQDIFLGYARVIESLHRFKDKDIETTFIDPMEYTKIIDKMMNSIKGEIDNNLFNKLSDNLKYSNEFGFQRRIKDILKSLPGHILEKVSYGMKTIKYADIVRINRDYYTHFFENQKIY